MSVPTGIQSNLVPLLISSDDITYKSVVCKKAANFNGTTPTNVEQTDCGPMVGLGSNEWSFDIEGVLNTAPAGATEISAKELLNYWNSQSAIYVKMQYPNPGGTNFYLQGAGYITSFKLGVQVGQLVNFSATFSGNGTVDNTP
jgi:hypothetical protein